MIFLQVVPDDQYFVWQVEVQICNFRKHNISQKMEVCVSHRNNHEKLKPWYKLSKKYPEVKFFFYENDSKHISLYIPILRPNALKKHFRFKRSKEAYFYHDSDIIFNYLPDFEKMEKDDICWQSDTSSYLDYNYIVNKQVEGNIPDNEALNRMLKSGGITEEIFKSYIGNTGGAQVILKGIDHSFWQDVEQICINIRKNFAHKQPDSINTKYFGYEAYQSWCADMWALNFALWKRGIKTQVTPELGFSWGTSSKEVYDKLPIFHNAGVLDSKGGLFYKGEWINTSPIGKNLPLPPENTASRMYVLEINNVAD